MDRFKDPDTEALKKRAQRFGLVSMEGEGRGHWSPSPNPRVMVWGLPQPAARKGDAASQTTSC